MSTRGSIIYNGIHAWRDCNEEQDLVFFDARDPEGKEIVARLSDWEMDLLVAGWVENRKTGKCAEGTPTPEAPSP